MHQAQFSIGQLIVHKKLNYRGVRDEGDAEELEYEVNHGFPVIVAFLEDNEEFYQSLLETIRS